MTEKNEDQDQDEKDPEMPEPCFFDKPEGHGTLGFLIGGLLGKSWLRWVLALAVPILLMFFFFTQAGPKEQKRALDTDGERRLQITASGLEREIDAGGKGKRVSIPRRKETGASAKKKSFESGIAVFVAKNEVAPKPSTDQRRRGTEAPLGLPSGTKIPALLEDRVFSFNLATPVLAVLPKDFIGKEKVAIPEGTQFLGEVNVLKSMDRINVHFDRLIFPDGRELRVRAMALSADGSAGIRGRVEKHGDMKVLRAIGESLLAGASLFVGGGRTDPFSIEDQMRLSLTENLTDQAARDLRAIKTDKSVTVEAYTPIQVLLLDGI